MAAPKDKSTKDIGFYVLRDLAQVDRDRAGKILAQENDGIATLLRQRGLKQPWEE